MDLAGMLVLVALCVIVALEAWRGGGRALFDAAALVIAVKLAAPIATRFAVGAARDEALMLGLFFVLFGGALLVGAKLLADTTLWSFEPFNGLVGGIFGVVAGGAALHAILRVLLLVGRGSPLADSIMGSEFAVQFVDFRAFHALIDWLSNLSGTEYEVT
jgi:hypothetical protein